MPKTFGEVLQGLMKARNLTARALARELGLPHKTIAEWIAPGARMPRSPDALKKLASYFGCSIHYLLYGEEEPHNLVSEILEKTELHTGLYEITIRRVKTKTEREKK